MERGTWTRIMALVLLVGVVSWVAQAWAWPWSQRKEATDVTLRQILTDPEAFVGQRVVFDCRFALSGRFFRRDGGDFAEGKHLNFAIWPVDAMLWDDTDRRTVLPTCYVDTARRDAVNSLGQLRRYQAARMEAEVRSGYANLPWLDVRAITILEEEHLRLEENVVQALRKGVEARDGKRAKEALERFESALDYPAPQPYKVFARRNADELRIELGLAPRTPKPASERAGSGRMAAGPTTTADAFQAILDGEALPEYATDEAPNWGRPIAAPESATRVAAHAEDTAAMSNAKGGEMIRIPNIKLQQPNPAEGASAATPTSGTGQNGATDGAPMAPEAEDAPSAEAPAALAVVDQARAAAAAGHFAEAGRLYGQVIAAESALTGAGWLRKEVGALYESRFDAMGNPDLLTIAAREYGYALGAARGEDPEAVFLLARVAFKRALVEDHPDFVEAKRRLRTVLAGDPASVPGRILEARILAAEGRYAQGFDQVTGALRSDPKAVEGHVVLGRIYEGMEEPGMALAAYERALELAPNHREALRRYIAAALALERPGEARVKAFDLVRLEPDRLPHRVLFGSILNQTGEYEEALRQFAYAIEDGADGVPARLGLIEAYAALERPAEALVHARAILRDLPEHAEAAAWVARLDGTEAAGAEATPARETGPAALVGPELTESNDVDGIRIGGALAEKLRRLDEAEGEAPSEMVRGTDATWPDPDRASDSAPERPAIPVRALERDGSAPLSRTAMEQTKPEAVPGLMEAVIDGTPAADIPAADTPVAPPAGGARAIPAGMGAAGEIPVPDASELEMLDRLLTIQPGAKKKRAARAQPEKHEAGSFGAPNSEIDATEMEDASEVEELPEAKGVLDPRLDEEDAPGFAALPAPSAAPMEPATPALPATTPPATSVIEPVVDNATEAEDESPSALFADPQSETMALEPLGNLAAPTATDDEEGFAPIALDETLPAETILGAATSEEALPRSASAEPESAASLHNGIEPRIEILESPAPAPTRMASEALPSMESDDGETASVSAGDAAALPRLEMPRLPILERDNPLESSIPTPPIQAEGEDMPLPDAALAEAVLPLDPPHEATAPGLEAETPFHTETVGVPAPTALVQDPEPRRTVGEPGSNMPLPPAPIVASARAMSSPAARERPNTLTSNGLRSDRADTVDTEAEIMADLESLSDAMPAAEGGTTTAPSDRQAIDASPASKLTSKVQPAAMGMRRAGGGNIKGNAPKAAAPAEDDEYEGLPDWAR